MKILAGVVLGALAMTAMSNPADATPLDSLRWQSRVLLVFDGGDGQRLSEQRRIVEAERAGFTERDLLVIAVPRSGPAGPDGAYDAAELRRAFAVPADAPFTVLLVGKDGGVKRRESEPLLARDLFETIDAMPMRANEVAPQVRRVSAKRSLWMGGAAA